MNEEKAYCTICRQPLDGSGRCRHCDEESHVWTIRDWRPLLTLALVIVLGFSFTRLVVNLYNQKESALAAEYYAAGMRAMEAQHAAEAVDAFETALVYSRDNFQYRLRLTDALVASGATGEAEAQLRAFWEQRPEDAQVNLKLARLAAKQQRADDALRYFQNAIEGVWPERSDPVPQRIEARFEEAEWLIELERQEQAGAALLALAAVLPESSPEQERLAELLLRNGDAGQALKVFETALKYDRAERRNVTGNITMGGSSQRLEHGPKAVVSEQEAWSARYRAALLGAAKASFATADYTLARRYLEELKPETAESQELRLELERVEALDPFARSATGRIRTQRTVAAFRIAVLRLAGCGVPFAQAMSGRVKSGNTADPAQWSGFAKWAEQLAPMMSERRLRGEDDVIESAMRFAFQAEMAAQKDCGKPTLNDEALLLLARERMGGK
jgi:tetratricopeptide (TPR) repeat protein